MPQAPKQAGSKGKKQRVQKNKKKRKRQKKERFLIVMEGTVTEEIYFQHLNRCDIARGVVIKTEGTGRSEKSIVQYAIDMRRAHADDGDDYSEVWVVFDKDSVENNKISAAFDLADNNDINCAFSYECFEYWLLLHLTVYTADTTRNQLRDKITEHARKASFSAKKNNFKYDKTNREFVEYLDIGNNTKVAIARAEQQDSDLNIQDDRDRIKQAPSTGMWRLVKRLIS